jgi:hypothetical protein
MEGKTMGEGGKSVHKKAFSFLLFLVITLGVIVMIKIVNWLPLALQKDTLRKYRSIEEVKAGLHIENIYVPAYFPQTLSWPPSHLFAQSKPFPGILMTFDRINGPQNELIIIQAVSESFSGKIPVAIDRINEKVHYEFLGRKAFLEVGTCGNEPCSRLAWREGDYHMIVFMRSAPFELIKIAESMIR